MSNDTLSEIEAELVRNPWFSGCGDNEYNPCRHHDMLTEAMSEVRRLREQVRIATDTLGTIARCGCSRCGDSMVDVTQAQIAADDALIQMSVVE